MPFSDLGKLLEIIEDIIKEMERNGMASGEIDKIKHKIWHLKQKEEFK